MKNNIAKRTDINPNFHYNQYTRYRTPFSIPRPSSNSQDSNIFYDQSRTTSNFNTLSSQASTSSRASSVAHLEEVSPTQNEAVRNLHKQLSEHINKINTLKLKCQGYQSEINRNLTKILKYETEKVCNDKQIRDYEIENCRLRKENSKLSAECREANSDYRKTLDERTEVHNEISKLTSQIYDLQLKLETANKLSEAKTLALSSIQAPNLNSDIKKLVAENRKLLEKNENSNRRLYSFNQELDKVQKQLYEERQFSAKFEEKVKECHIKNKQIQELFDQKKILEDDVKQKQLQFYELQQHKNNLVVERNKFKDDYDNVINERDNYVNKVLDLQSQNDKLLSMVRLGKHNSGSSNATQFSHPNNNLQNSLDSAFAENTEKNISLDDNGELVLEEEHFSEVRVPKSTYPFNISGGIDRPSHDNSGSIFIQKVDENIEYLSTAQLSLNDKILNINDKGLCQKTFDQANSIIQKEFKTGQVKVHVKRKRRASTNTRTTSSPSQNHSFSSLPNRSSHTVKLNTEQSVQLSKRLDFSVNVTSPVLGSKSKSSTMLNQLNIFPGDKIVQVNRYNLSSYFAKDIVQLLRNPQLPYTQVLLSRQNNTNISASINSISKMSRSSLPGSFGVQRLWSNFENENCNNFQERSLPRAGSSSNSYGRSKVSIGSIPLSFERRNTSSPVKSFYNPPLDQSLSNNLTETSELMEKPVTLHRPTPSTITTDTVISPMDISAENSLESAPNQNFIRHVSIKKSSVASLKSENNLRSSQSRMSPRRSMGKGGSNKKLEQQDLGPVEYYTKRKSSRGHISKLFGALSLKKTKKEKNGFKDSKNSVNDSGNKRVFNQDCQSTSQSSLSPRKNSQPSLLTRSVSVSRAHDKLSIQVSKSHSGKIYPIQSHKQQKSMSSSSGTK